MAGAIAPGIRTITSPGGNSPGLAATPCTSCLPRAVNEGLGADPFDRLDREVERDAAGDGLARNHKILGTDSQNAGSLPAARLSPANCDLISSERSGIRFIGGAPMKEATKVVAGFW